MFRVSLRELFALVTVAAVAVLSLLYASFFWQTLVGLAAMLAALIAMIVGLVDRGPRRAFAIGFAVAMLGYWIAVINAPRLMNAPNDMSGQGGANPELDVLAGRLPTSVMLRYLYAGTSRTFYYDVNTDEPIPASQSGNVYPVGERGYASARATQTPPAGQRAVYYKEWPNPAYLMPVGHSWWALLFGYLGGHFARCVFVWRKQAELPPAA